MEYCDAICSFTDFKRQKNNMKIRPLGWVGEHNIRTKITQVMIFWYFVKFTDNSVYFLESCSVKGLGIDLFAKLKGLFYLQLKDKLDCITSAAIAAPPPAATFSYDEGSNSILDGNPRYGVNENLSSLRFVNQG